MNHFHWSFLCKQTQVSHVSTHALRFGRAMSCPNSLHNCRSDQLDYNHLLAYDYIQIEVKLHFSVPVHHRDYHLSSLNWFAPVDAVSAALDEEVSSGVPRRKQDASHLSFVRRQLFREILSLYSLYCKSVVHRVAKTLHLLIHDRFLNNQ